MRRKLVFATNNAHKLEEVSAILGDKVELLSLNDINCHTDIPETAETLEGNAYLKSSFIYRNYGLNCFADDTGLEVESLGGAPGVYSARYAGGEGTSGSYMTDNLYTECAYYPESKKLVVINNSDTEQTTTIPTEAGACTVTIAPYDTTFVEIR